jgi:hypothetical protein
MNRPYPRIIEVVVVLLVGVIGSVFILESHAAVPAASIELETATVGGGASVVSDSGASSGKAIKFGSSSKAPAPAVPVTAAPAGSKNTTPKTAPTSQSPPPVAPIVTPPATTPNKTGKLPAQVLDLLNWKLVLPTAGASASTPKEVMQPQLANFALNPYFFVNAAGNGVAFQANAAGTAPSPSGYPRSELREMMSNGQSLASWSTIVGTHTMTIKQAITHLPVARPITVAGEIRNANLDVVQVVADGTKKNSDGTIGLCINFRGTEQTTCLDDHYSLGATFTVQFIASASHIQVLYNGVQKFNFLSIGSGNFFEAGAYVQSNTATGDGSSAYGEVIIYGLTVTHA